jgi:hypothetical protein
VSGALTLAAKAAGALPEEFCGFCDHHESAHEYLGAGQEVPCVECVAERCVRAESLRTLPVQGPVGAPFRPGDRFRWRSGNGRVVRTGTILEWNVPYPNTRSGHWYVEVDPLPKPRGARVLKRNPWDGFRTWMDADEFERVTS